MIASKEGMCPECGNPIDYSVRNRNSCTCSVKCQTARTLRRFREKRGLPPPTPRKGNGRCSECDKPIDYTVRSWCSVTCSEDCQKKRVTRKYEEKRSIVVLERRNRRMTCVSCGLDYAPYSVPNGWKYCSRKCRSVYQKKKRIQDRVKALEKMGKSIPKRDCYECGKPIDFSIRQANALACSEECQKLRARRDVRVPVKVVHPNKVIDRNCSECGIKIDFSLRGTSAVTCSIKCGEERTLRLAELRRSYPATSISPTITTSHGFYRGEREGGFNLKPNHCIYCGDWYQCRDHIVPILVDAVERSYDPRKTCHCCSLCNNLAGDYWAESIEDKAQHLLARYRRKFRVVLFQNSWSDSELDDLMGGLHEFVRSKQNMKRLIEAKVDNLIRVSSGIEALRLNEELFYQTGKKYGADKH